MRTRVILSAILFVSVLGVASPPASQDPITAKQMLAWMVGGMSMDHLTTQMASRPAEADELQKRWNAISAKQQQCH